MREDGASGTLPAARQGTSFCAARSLTSSRWRPRMGVRSLPTPVRSGGGSPPQSGKSGSSPQSAEGTLGAAAIPAEADRTQGLPILALSTCR